MSVEIEAVYKRLVQSKVFLAFVLIFVASLFVVQHASAAGMGSNSRLNYGNAGVYCAEDNAPGYWAKGMVWLSNDDSDYYSESVTIPTNATSARVSIRGAVNTCNTVFDAATEMWAVNVSTSYLSGLEGNRFWRGNVPGGARYAWSTAGSKLYGNLNVSGIAPCNAASMQTGYAQESVRIGITRQQMQQRPSTGYYWVSPTIGTEWVSVTVTRTCPRFDYNLNPTIDIPSSDQVVSSAAGSFSVTGRVTNTGPTGSRPNVDWRLTEIKYRNTGEAIPTPPAGGTAELPCAFFGKRGGANIPGYSCNDSITLKGTEASGYGYPGSNTKTYTKNDFNIGDEKVGTRICYVMSVRQFNQGTENWRHSAPRCVIVSKAPKTQVLGGDLIVGRSLLPSKYNVKTSTMRQSSGLFYGSLAEYAITATGKIEGMASASGFQGGASSADMCAASLGLLSFNNTTSSGSCALGTFANNTAAPGDAIAAFFSRMPSQNTSAASLNVRDLAANIVHKVTTSGNVVRLSSSSSVPANKWVVVYAPGKTVVVTSNIQYTSSAVAASQTPPQVVIIASKIVVADSVNVVDSWLVTTGTNGTINTCGVGAGFSETASPTATVCGGQLRVNGPTITSHLLLRRTAGSEPPTRMGEPAEIFNLRPDAYLWMTTAFGGAQKVTTVSSKELPPRF